MFFNKLVARSVRFLNKSDGEQQIGKRILHGISWAVISSFTIRFFTFGVSLIHSRLLGKQGYGELGIILNTLILFGMLASGYGATCAKYIPELRITNPTRAGRIFALSTVLVLAISIISSLSLFFSADVIARQSLKAPHLASLLRLAAIALSLQCISGICDGVLSGLQAFKRRNITGLAQVVVWLPSAAILTLIWGLQGAIIAYVISYFSGTLFYVSALIKECHKQKFKPVFEKILPEFIVILNYTLPMMLNSFLVIPTNWICSAMLVQQTDGYAALGSYNAANQWRILVLQIPFLIQSTVSPVMNELLGNSNTTGFLKLFFLSYKAIFFTVFTTTVGGILLSKPLMSIFGSDFTSEYLVMCVVIMTSAIVCLSGFIGNTIQVINQPWVNLIINMILGLVAISLSAILIPKYGAIGLALSFLISYFIQGSISIYVLNLFLKDIKMHLLIGLLATLVLTGIIEIFIMQTSEILGMIFALILIGISLGFAYQRIYPNFLQLTKRAK